jgi:hypothetical protein
VTLRIGVIGATGHQGKRYLDPKNVPECVETFAVPRGERNTQSGAIILATPAPTHAELAIEAMRGGYHVLCEKPMATSMYDAASMEKVARATKRVLLIAHTHLWHPDFLSLRSDPSAQVFWRGEERRDCPAVLDWGAHAWSMALHLGTERVATGIGDRSRNCVRSCGEEYPDPEGYEPDQTPMYAMLETFASLIAGGQDWRAAPEFALEVMRRCLRT